MQRTAQNHPAERLRRGERPTEPLTFEEDPLVFEDPPAAAAQVEQLVGGQQAGEDA